MNFHALAWAYTFTNWLNSANALLCFLKLFKYLGGLPSLEFCAPKTMALKSYEEI